MFGDSVLMMREAVPPLKSLCVALQSLSLNIVMTSRATNLIYLLPHVTSLQPTTRITNRATNRATSKASSRESIQNLSSNHSFLVIIQQQTVIMLNNHQWLYSPLQSWELQNPLKHILTKKAYVMA